MKSTTLVITYLVVLTNSMSSAERLRRNKKGRKATYMYNILLGWPIFQLLRVL